MAAAADVFARRFFEQPSTGISALLALAENKKAPKQALGAKGDGAGPNSRQNSMLLPAVRSRRSPISMPATVNL
jgi:hypothetical protein